VIHNKAAPGSTAIHRPGSPQDDRNLDRFALL
jgi:hypothetical protein